MKHHIVISTLAALLVCSNAWAQEAKPPVVKDRTAEMTKKIEQLERQLEAMLRQVRELKQELQQTPLQLQVFALKNAKSAEVAQVLEAIYARQPTVRVAADARSNQVLVSADAKTALEIEALVNRLDR